MICPNPSSRRAHRGSVRLVALRKKNAGRRRQTDAITTQYLATMQRINSIVRGCSLGLVGSLRLRTGLRAVEPSHLAMLSGSTFVSEASHSAPNDGPVNITFGDVSQANYRIRDRVHRTPCRESKKLSRLLDARVFVKNEFMHPTGSFKERGARNALLIMSHEQR